MKGQKGQDVPGWAVVIGIILALIGLGVMIYIAVKSGKIGASLFGG